MREVNLLARYPRTRRNLVARRAGQEANRALALQFGREYFDGTREQGYGGYHYDGRWQAIAADIVSHFDLKPGDNVLDVGCAKGFLMRDLQSLGLEVQGIDVSDYAIEHCHPEVRGRILRGSADALPFPDASFNAVISINAIHNLDRDGCVTAVRELERVAPGKGYIQVDAYRDEAERDAFLAWALTARTHGTPAMWRALFAEAGYTGSYFWTILELDADLQQ